MRMPRGAGAGSAGWIWTSRFLTTRRSRSTATAAYGHRYLAACVRGVVRACMDAGLVKGEGFAVDASVMEADASRYHGKAPDEIDWSVREPQTRTVAESDGARSQPGSR